MSISSGQLLLIERLLNLPGVRVLDADNINEREAPIHVETDDDHAMCHNCGEKATEFYGYGMSLRLRHFQVFDRRVYLYPRTKRFSCLQCYDRPTTARLDDWYDAQSGMTRAFAESLLKEIVGGAMDDALLKHRISYDLLCGILKCHVVSGVEGLNDNAPAVISGVRSDRRHAGL